VQTDLQTLKLTLMSNHDRVIEPVVAAIGHIVERQAMQGWLSSCSARPHLLPKLRYALS